MTDTSQRQVINYRHLTLDMHVKHVASVKMFDQCLTLQYKNKLLKSVEMGLTTDHYN